jgi:hypothetical protein
MYIFLGDKIKYLDRIYSNFYNINMSFVLDPSYNTTNLIDGIYTNEIFAYPGTGGYSTIQTMNTIQRLPEQQINIFDTTGSVQILMPVSVFNAKLGLFKTNRSSSNGFLLDTMYTSDFYDNSENRLKNDSIILTALDFKQNIPQPSSIVSVGKFSTLYTDFANYVASYFHLANPSVDSVGFATLFNNDFHFDPNQGIFDASALYQIINGNNVIDPNNHSGITNLSGTVTISNITSILRYAVDANPFGNRDPNNGINAIDPSNSANYGVSDGFMAGDIIFIPNNGFSIQLNLNINFGATINNYIQNNPNQTPVIQYIDTSLNPLSEFHTTSTNTQSYIGRQMSTPLLLRLVDTVVAIADTMPEGDIAVDSSLLTVRSTNGIEHGLTIFVGTLPNMQSKTMIPLS